MKDKLTFKIRHMRKIITNILQFIVLQNLLSIFLNTVVSSSMLPTVEYKGFKPVFVNIYSYKIGSPIFNNRLDINYRKIKRGDIISFYESTSSETFIKRVIGIPGDRISSRGEELYINDILISYPLNDSYNREYNLRHNTVLASEKGSIRLYEEVIDGVKYLVQYDNQEKIQDREQNFYELTVPEDCYFVLGDNRHNSSDSRYLGFIHKTQIIGQVFFYIKRV